MINWPLMFKAWGISLSLTLILELSYACLWGIRDRHDLVLAVLVNVLTNPIVVFAVYFVRFRRYSIHPGWLTIVMEIFAVAAEGFLYRKHARTIDRPWLFSLSANAFSYAMGELLNGIF